MPIPSGFLLIFARAQCYLRYRGLLVHFASARHRKLIAEQLPFLTYVNIDLSFFIRSLHDISSDSTLRIRTEQLSSFQTKQINMYSNKGNPIIVTKTQHTAEEFIQKKIELMVKITRIIRSIDCCFVFLLQKDEVEPFYAVDLEDICNKHIRWITLMPRVTPHFGSSLNNTSC